jgi:hypothetical protein
MATTVTIRERDAGFSAYPSAPVSARRPAGLGAGSGADRLTKLALVAADAVIWLYVTAALGLAA